MACSRYRKKPPKIPIWMSFYSFSNKNFKYCYVYKNYMTEGKIPPLEEEVPEIKDEIKKEPEYKDASMPDDLWKSWLERRKTGQTTVGQGVGDASLGNPHESGTQKDWDKPVAGKTYIDNEEDKS